MKKGANVGRSTLRDVAEHAGVSLATASYAPGQGQREASAVSTTKVLEAARALRYEARPRGRPASRPLTVGAIVPQANSFFAEVLREMEEVLGSQAHQLLIASSCDEPLAEEQLVRRITGRIDGLMLAPAGEAGAAVRQLAGREVPVVLMDRDGNAPELTSVSIDNFASARQATKTLVEAGHRRIALVNGPTRVSTAQGRLRGYEAAIEEAGLSIRKEYLGTAEFTFQGGRQGLQHLLRLRERPEAIFSSSAILTSGLLFSLREHGLHWPDDMAVVGFGDAVWASLIDPPSTVVEQPTAELGKTAVSFLLARVRNKTHAPQHLVLGSRLALRESHWRTRSQGSKRDRRLGRWAPTVRPIALTLFGYQSV